MTGFLLAYLMMMALLFLAGDLFFAWKMNRFRKSKTENRRISVVIPFRNEATTLPALLESINRLHMQPLEFIFVNDHSNDDSLEILAGWKTSVLHQLLHLDGGESGKKTALRKGIAAASGNFILTWDADIRVPSRFFDELSKQGECDLLILPVKMEGSGLSEFFFELDYYNLNKINTTIHGLKRPIMASGASLLFRKSCFEQDDRGREHAHISSGDDVFLLLDFIKGERTICLSMAENLQVLTKAPASLADFIRQRLRWASKTARVKDQLANLTGVLGLAYHLSAWLLFVMTHFDFSVLFLKILLDALFVFPYLLDVKRFFLIILLPFYSLGYPFYLLLMLGLSLTYKPRWKGRKIT